MMARNPFQYLQPTTHDAFVGRWPLVKHIAYDLAHNEGNSHAIIAGQRCGKTSLLMTLAHQLRQQTQQGESDYWVLPLYVDFKAGKFDSAEAVFSFMLNRIYRQLNAVMQDQPMQRLPLTMRPGNRWFEQLLSMPTLTVQVFEEGLGYVLDQIAIYALPVRLVVLLDGIDSSLGQPWTEALYSQTRALLCSSDLRNHLRVVLTSSQRLLDGSMNNIPLFDVLNLHYFEPLDQSGFNQLLAQSADLPRELAARIWQQSGGHPFLAQYLLSHLWEQTQLSSMHDATVELIDQMAARFLATRSFEFEGWTQTLGESALDVYQVLETTAGWIPEEQIIMLADMPAPQVKRGLLALCCQGLAEHNEAWSHYRYSGDLFRTWFKQCGASLQRSIKQSVATAEINQHPAPITIAIDTGGGPYIAGNVNTQGGGFTGRDHTVDDHSMPVKNKEGTSLRVRRMGQARSAAARLNLSRVAYAL
jgi:hypothetical protein